MNLSSCESPLPELLEKIKKKAVLLIFQSIRQRGKCDE
jgi:hypothetical protein